MTLEEEKTLVLQAKHHPEAFGHLFDEYGISWIDSQTAETEKEAVERQLNGYQDFLLIQSKLKLLPIKYQEVIALRHFEDKNIKEIVEILGKKEGTVKSLLSRGLTKLRFMLQ